MSDILCITNRTLCRDDFLPRLERIAQCAPAGILLREKDLSASEYLCLAEKVIAICKEHLVPFILPGFVSAGIALKAAAIHLPLPLLRQMRNAQKANFSAIGTSCHSFAEALEAEAYGCTYLIAGHIFATDCKKGMPPRGTEFLRTLCGSVSIPVYAIGGIDSRNIASVRRAGAKGACTMSGCMRCTDVARYLKDLEKGEPEYADQP